MYKVGVCQFQPKLFDIEYNINKMKELLLDIKADLIVLPELATSGYVFNSKEEVEKIAEDAQNGVTATLFKELAQKNDCSYVVGIAEKFEGKLYNSSILVNPDGQVTTYRKTHLFYEEKLWFEPGDTGFVVAEAKNGVKVGLMICFDWIFPEAARSLMINGAQIIAQAANLVLPWCQKAMITRAIENRVFTITSNRTGLEKNSDKELYFTGMSQVASTKGEVLINFSEVEESVKIVEIDVKDSNDKQINAHNNILIDRRMDLYSLK